MTRDEFMLLLAHYMDRYPSQRYGQAVFNLAYRQFPERVEPLRSGASDPFYMDEKVDSFLFNIGIV